MHQKIVATLRHSIIRSEITLIIACCQLTIGLVPLELQAQPRKALTGRIEMEEEAPKVDQYSTVQENTIKFFSELLSKLQNPAAEAKQAVSLPDQEMVNFLSAVYLYCYSKSGVCPVVLDGLLEVDVFNSYFLKQTRQDKKVECSALRSFWRQWLANGFEERSKYLISAGADIVASTEFDQKQRPKYLGGCAEAVSHILQEDEATLLKTRFGVDGLGRANLNRLLRFLELVKKKVPDVFVELGVKSPR